MEDWLRNKQYHQLTEALLKETMNQTLYDTYVLPVEQHIHPLKLAVLAGRTAQVKQPQDALIFLQNLLAKFTPSDEDFKRWTCFKIQAFLYLKLLLVQYHQVLLQHDTAQLLLDQVKVAMERVLSFEPIVSAQYYRVVSDVYQTKGEYELYYEASFEYLKYAEHMTKEDRYHRSMHMAIAALLGNTYRFGELMGHPIFEHVDPWMRSVIVAAEGGQLVQLDQLKKDIMSHAVLKQHWDTLDRKFQMMALLCVLFQCNSKQVTFQQILQRARIANLEIQITRLMAQGLLKGKIDQVGEVLYIDALYPQVVSKEQVGHFIESIKGWQRHISGVQVNN